MAQVTIRNLSRITRNISLRREYDGIDGRCLYIRPRGVLLAPAEIVAEPELLREARMGVVSVTGERQEPEKKPEKTQGRSSRRKKKKED